VRTDFYVYVLFRPSGEPFYVGKGCGRRLNAHESDARGNDHKARIIRQAKAAGLEIPRVKIAESLTESGAFEIERAFIAALGRDPIGPLVNLTDGGEGTAGYRRSPELIEHHRQQLLGRTYSAEHRAAISAGQKGKPGLSAEAQARRVAKLTGRKLSPEHRAALSAGHKGRPCAEGTRLALIESNKRRAGRRT
jgi:hypothetical protein